MGDIEIKIMTKRINYKIILKRNITIIKGDSGTGKTTMINLISDWLNERGNIKIQKNTNRELVVMNTVDWNRGIIFKNSILFIEESNKFIFKKEFSDYIKYNNNYCVLITRKPIKTLPYSYKEIYKLNSKNKNERIYTKLYNIYDIDNLEQNINKLNINENTRLITEDSNSGYELYKYISLKNGNECVTSLGKDRILEKIKFDKLNIVIADGAAFGSNIDEYKELLDNNKIKLFLPESFEYILLISNLFSFEDNNKINEMLFNIQNIIDYTKHLSWENFYYEYLKNISIKYGNKTLYNKNRLKIWYLEDNQINKILNNLPKFINLNKNKIKDVFEKDVLEWK